MDMSRGKKSVIIFITVLCVIFGTLTIVNAGTNKANLTPSMKWKFSASYFGGVKKAYITSGTVKKGSKYKVYFINAVYKSESSAKTPSNYTQDTLKLVGVGKSLGSAVSSSTFSSKKYFRLLLNPYGENTTGCTASGTQKDSK